MKIKSLLVVLVVCVWVLSACQSAQISPTVTATATIALPTNTSTPTNTPKPTSTPEPTPNIAATQQYESFFSWVQKFHDEGLISSTEGKYTALDNFSDSYAVENTYKYTPYEYKTTNFIIQADVKIETAVKGLKYGGCGFAFWQTNDISGRAIFFFQDGRAFYTGGLAQAKPSNYIDADLGTDPAGVKLTLLVNDDHLKFYINDRLGMSRDSVSAQLYTSNSVIPLGLLGPAIASGSGENFGTKCDFTHIVLWIMD